MAYKVPGTEQNKASKAIAHQIGEQTSGGKRMPAVSPIQQKSGDDSDDKQANPSPKEDEGWDLAGEQDTAGVQISLPTTEQFASQTNAGIFARRDDLLKMIDQTLLQCNTERKFLYEVEVWLSKDHGPEEDARKEKFEEYGKDHRKKFNHYLNELTGLANAWLDYFKKDPSAGMARRRASIEALLPAIQAERQMTTAQRVQRVEEKEANEKAKAEVASRTIFTIAEFKAEANILLVMPFSNISDIISEMEAFHAIPDTPGDHSMRLKKIEACHRIMHAATDANRAIRELKDRPGYDKGHMGFEKKALLTRQAAIQKLLNQCSKYFRYHETEEEKNTRYAAIKAGK